MLALSCFTAFFIGCSSDDPEVCSVPDPDFPFMEITVPCSPKNTPPAKDSNSSSYEVTSSSTDNYCPSYLDGSLQPDEMTSTTSQELAEATRTCVCFDTCAVDCAVWDADNGAPQCEIGDPTYFVSLGGDLSVCMACRENSCSSEINACMNDGSF